MTDKEYRALKRKIESFCAMWRPRLGLQTWSLQYKFDRTGESFRETEGTAKTSVNASCVSDWRYLSATIAFNMVAMEEYGMEAIEEIVIHEHVHCLVNEMQAGGIDHEERVVTTMTSAFQGTRDAVGKNIMRKR